ncbi:MAG TPA: Flp pilus assembly protein CpaB [Vicinamibacterales bacterium]|jgi:pilus assembly protein CpaB
MRVLIVLVLALTAGGVLAFGTYNYLQKTPAQAASTIPTTPVVVAATDLDLGATLTKDDVRVIQWPANAVPQGAIKDPNEVVDRGLVLPVIQNEPILPLKLASKEAGAGLPPVITPGLRAVSVRVNEVIGVAGYVVPGTRVDVVVTMSPTNKQEETTSKVILTDVAVLAAGTKIERDTEKGKPIPVNVVTLLVNPDESERLTLAATEGKIQLALRNPLDKDNPQTKGIRPAMLLGSAPPVRQTPRALPVQAKVAQAAPDAPTVEIIRGDKRAREVVRGQEQ